MENSKEKIDYRIGRNTPADIFQINEPRPEGVPGPDTFGSLTYLPGQGLMLVMWCFEENPLARYTKPNEPVHTDSCMEGFINCFPELPGKGYISVEMNANGASHCSFGTGRHDRRYVIDLGLTHPAVEITRGLRDGRPYWQAGCLIPEQLLEALYGVSCSFAPGHLMRANFYKCAEDVANPYWSAWKPVSRLDFHMSEHFGYLIVL